jgi:hypothetical protein
VGDNQINDDKNAGTLLAILMAMTMQRYGTMCITQWSISRATLEAPTTGKCLCPITLTATMVIEIWGKHKKTIKHNFKATTVQINHNLFLRISYPEMDQRFTCIFCHRRLYVCTQPKLTGIQL